MAILGAPGWATAASWNPPQAFCDPCGRDVNSPPVLGVNDSGRAIVAWGRDGILVAERRGDRRFSPPVALSRGRRIGAPVAVAVGADGTRAVAWREGPDASDLVVRVRPPGDPWGPRRRFDGAPFEVAVGRDGTTYLVTSATAVLVRELPPGGRWSDAIRLSAHEAPMPLGAATTLDPVIRVGPGGHAMVAWTVQAGFPGAGDPYPRLGSAFRAPRGPWLPAEVAVTDPAPLTDREPRIALDGDGDALLTWRGRDGTLRSVHRPAAGGWQTPQVIGPVRPDALSAPADLAVDREGNALVAFVGPRGAGGSVDVARRSAASGRWSTPRRVSVGRWGPLDLAVALGGDGTGQVVWQERRGRGGRGIGTLATRVSSTSGSFGRVGFVARPVATSRTVGAVHAAASRAGAVTAVWQQPSLRARPTPARPAVAYVTAGRPAR